MSSRKINVALAIRTLSGGGAERVLELLGTGLDRQQFSTTIVELVGIGEKSHSLRERGFDVVSFVPDGNARRSYVNFWRLRKLIAARNIDLIHSHCPASLADAVACKWLTPRLKLVHTFHYGNYPHLSQTAMRIERVCHRFVDGMVAVGHRQAETIRATYGMPASRLEVIWNGIDARPLQLDTELLAPVLGQGKVLIGTIGTLFEQKGHVDLLEVAALLKARGLPVTFLVVGAGPLSHELKARCEALNLDDTVKFLGWVKDAADRVMGALDIFFQPSRWEAMSMVLLEAAVAGKAIVCTDVGESSRILVHNESALFTHPRDVAGMADAIERIVAQPALRHRLGAAAREIVQRECTTAAMLRQYQALYLALSTDGAALKPEIAGVEQAAH